MHLHGNNLIALIQLHTDHAHGYTSCYADICFMETNTLALLCYHENILGIVRYLYLDQLVIFTQHNSLKSVFADISVFL